MVRLLPPVTEKIIQILDVLGGIAGGQLEEDWPQAIAQGTHPLIKGLRVGPLGHESPLVANGFGEFWADM